MSWSEQPPTWQDRKYAAPRPERRTEERHSASGELLLYVDATPPFTVQARLLNISKHGFLASHSNPELRAGQEVEIFDTVAQVRARVVWTRIAGDYIESGFRVLHGSAEDWDSEPVNPDELF